METERYVFYFAPHQDDEISNLGAALTTDLLAGKQVFCVLCTDGSASGARRLIGNGKACHLHGGKHPAGMEVPAFVAARDKEYKACCAAMGLPDAAAVIPEGRAPDGKLTAQTAKRLILEATAGFPPEAVTVKTLYPIPQAGQNPDHTAVGLAARALWERGAFGGLGLFYEAIHLAAGLLEGEDFAVLRPGSAAQKARLLAAADAYNRWEPEKGFYAVGWHSVYDEFAAFVADPFSLAAPAQYHPAAAQA